MQSVALNPFAAIKQPAEGANGIGNPDSERILHRMTRAHLIRDWTDSADACGDVRRLVESTTSHKGFKEPRRFEDLQLHVRYLLALHLHQKGAFAFDACQVIDFDGPTFHAIRSPGGRVLHRR